MAGVAAAAAWLLVASAGTSQSEVVRQADQLLDAVVAPPGSARVHTLEGTSFAEPFYSLDCRPGLVDRTRYFIVASNAYEVALYLDSHMPSWIVSSGGIGRASQRGVVETYGVQATPVGRGWDSHDELVFDVAPLGNGQTGVRADAQVLPPGTGCTSDPMVK